jgi:hypothetical protein
MATIGSRDTSGQGRLRGLMLKRQAWVEEFSASRLGTQLSGIIGHVSAQTLTAAAAISAAIISLINVALTAIFAQRQAGVRLLRELLPELIGEFTGAAF